MTTYGIKPIKETLRNGKVAPDTRWCLTKNNKTFPESRTYVGDQTVPGRAVRHSSHGSHAQPGYLIPTPPGATRGAYQAEQAHREQLERRTSGTGQTFYELQRHVDAVYLRVGYASEYYQAKAVLAEAEEKFVAMIQHQADIINAPARRWHD
jgi:hypothetical protein